MAELLCERVDLTVSCSQVLVEPFDGCFQFSDVGPMAGLEGRDLIAQRRDYPRFSCGRTLALIGWPDDGFICSGTDLGEQVGVVVDGFAGHPRVAGHAVGVYRQPLLLHLPDRLFDLSGGAGP